MNNINVWKPPRIWEGGECYIIGGGPSVPRLFDVPEGLVQAVLKKEKPLSVFSDYFKPIHDKHIIGINSAFLLGNWIDVCFFGDATWYSKNREALSKFPKLKISCSPEFSKPYYLFDGVKYIPRDKKRMGLSMNPDTIVWNYHSGGAAIDLAVHFGVSKIILLGFDMCNDGAGVSHWHSEYDQPSQNHKMQVQKKPPYRRHLKAYPTIAEHARQMGITILNTNPDSKITEFKVVGKPWAQ